MKKIITFDKSLDFPKMIGEVTSIELEHTLKFIDSSDVVGDFLISGTYKMTEASQLEEKFDYKIPVDIALTEELEIDTSKIEIDDFYYEIENDDTMICHIDVKIEGVEHVEEVKEEFKEIEEDIKLEVIDDDEVKVEDVILDDKISEEKENLSEVRMVDDVSLSKIDDKKENITRECDGDISDDVCNIKNNEKDDMMNDNQEEIEEVENTNVGSLFSSLKDSDETFSTYSVYIIRETESIESIINKYKVTKEDLENYNDLSNLEIGSKIIIPTVNE